MPTTMCVNSTALPSPVRPLRHSRLGFAWLAVFLIAAGLSARGVFHRPATEAPNTIAANRPVTAPDVDGPFRIQSIGETKVGDRSYGRNPDRSQVDETIPDVDPDTWRELRLRMVKSSGKLLWIDLLRSLTWIEGRQARVGGTVWLELPEFGAVGEAEVLYLGPCPEIKPGPGNVVTAKFKHESDGNLFNLQLADQEELTGVTGNHPYWSLDRSEFLEVANLRRGERVNTAYGPTTVVSLTPIPEDELVYNLEIHREHVFRVGSLGTLVHNAYPVPGSYVDTKYVIDMAGAPAGSVTNAAGYARNGPWFWRQMLSTFPDLFSPENARLIRDGVAPLVDDAWIAAHRTHQSFKGTKLVHHHIDQGAIASGLPKIIHEKWHAALHPNP